MKILNRPLRSRRKVRKGEFSLSESDAGLGKKEHFPKTNYDSPKTPCPSGNPTKSAVFNSPFKKRRTGASYGRFLVVRFLSRERK
jgi:hypothetical protein